MGLGLWEGNYEQVRGLWLRFYDRQENWIPTPMELAQREQQRADRERMRADRASLELQQLQDPLQMLEGDRASDS